MLPSYTQLGRDYKKSGYDQGHNMAEADNACSPVTDDEFWYYSNITPQRPQLNRFPWRLLEEPEAGQKGRQY
jgi:endonuclease G